MNIQALRSDHIYRQVMQVPLAEKTELYREEMLAPFMKNGRLSMFHIRLLIQAVLT